MSTESNKSSGKRQWFGHWAARKPVPHPGSSNSLNENEERPPSEKWSLGILNDKKTEEVPGTVLLLSSNRNEPLGLRHQPDRVSVSSLPSPFPGLSRRVSSIAEKKKTSNGEILLDPQPEDSLNDPLNWPSLRRDCALLSLGFYCMLGGGITPILAAGFNDVAKTFDVSYQRVALTTGLYMMGLGVGSVIFCPTAILFGKRPVYLGSAIMFVLTSIWCAKSPDFAQLATARVFQGISVSPVECLPSATIAEIFFLHERAFRVGIYTLLLLGGKNLIPLISAAIIEAKEWRWVFYIVAVVAGFGFAILLLFVPETFWDRTPRPKSKRPSHRRTISQRVHNTLHQTRSHEEKQRELANEELEKVLTPRQQQLHDLDTHARFVEPNVDGAQDQRPRLSKLPVHTPVTQVRPPTYPSTQVTALPRRLNRKFPYYLQLERNGDYLDPQTSPTAPPRVAALPHLQSWDFPYYHDLERDEDSLDCHASQAFPASAPAPPLPHLHNLNSPYYLQLERNSDYLDHHASPAILSSVFQPVVGSDAGVVVPGVDGARDQRPLRLSMLPIHSQAPQVQPINTPARVPALPHLHNLNSPYYFQLERNADYLDHHTLPATPSPVLQRLVETHETLQLASSHEKQDLELAKVHSASSTDTPQLIRYTSNLRSSPPKTYLQTLKPWNGRLNKANWFRVAVRPFILFAYPSVLWSTLVYSLSVGWLIVLSESVSNIYRNKETYNFSALGTGLVYISPFIGGILGTAVAGKVSDIIVRYMSRKNGGVYEPEFRLVMAAPVAISTAIGLMGYGWSAQERDRWIVPTVFFGIISFGCSLGSTTAITFCVDSYRQFAGEALVTLNFSKNIFHGLVFSLFFPHWLESDGSKSVFLAIGGIQMACLLTTIPMYIYGKRARMMTVRKGLMERF